MIEQADFSAVKSCGFIHAEIIYEPLQTIMRKIIHAFLFFIIILSSLTSQSQELNKTNLIGKWVAKGEETRISYIIFEKEGYATFEIEGEVIGGKDFTIKGEKAEMKYEINNNVEPNQIDFIVTKLEKGEQMKLLCIAKFKSKNILHFAITNGDERPTDFHPNFSVILERFE